MPLKSGSLRSLLTGVRGIPDSVVYRWKLGEGSGQTITDSVGSLDGTLNGGTWVSDANSVGGEHIDFDGVDDNIDFGQVQNTPQASTAFWVNFDTLPSPSGAVYPFYWSLNAGNNAGFGVRIDDEKIRIGVNDTNSDTSWTPVSGSWLHIGVSYFSTADCEFTVYNADTDTETTEDFANVGGGTINDDPRVFRLMEDSFGGGANVDGKLDDVHTADAGLSRDEIRTIRAQSPRA